LSFGGWVYEVKTQRDLNMQLLGAVRKGDAEAARSLLKRGADPNIRDLPDEQLNLWQLIQHAFHKDRQIAQDQTKTKTMIEMAMAPDSNPNIINVALVRTLLEAGARPDDCSDDVTPLMTAVDKDSLQTVQMLLDHGANPLAKDDDGTHPIHFMSTLYDDPDKLKIADLLIKSGEDVNVTDNNGNTVLMYVCGWRDIPALRFLIAHGARVDVRDDNGDTPLIRYFKLQLPEHIPTVRFLIAHGANVNQRNKDGETALSLAKNREDKQSIRLLKAAGAKR